MYKILIRNREANDTSKVEKYSFYKEASKDFETADVTVAFDKMNNLLDSYLRKDIQLVTLIEAEAEYKSAEVKTVMIKSDIFKIINDGKTFQITIELPENGKYVVVEVNEEIFKPIKSALEKAGLKDVKISPKTGITATNETEKPIELSIEAEKGLYTFYSRETGTSNFVSSPFSLLIKESSGEDVDPDVVDPTDPLDPDKKKKYKFIVANSQSAVLNIKFTSVETEKYYLYLIGSNTNASVELEEGKYNYTATATGYQEKVGQIEVNDKTPTLKIDMDPED